MVSKIEKFTYQDYTKCITDITTALLQPPSPAVAPPDVSIETMDAYQDLDETSVSFALAGSSGAPEDLRRLRIGFYSDAGTPVAITEAPDLSDMRLPRNGTASLVFSLSAFPKTMQLCAEIADGTTGKTVATKHLFMVFHSLGNYGTPAPVGQFVEASGAESERLEASHACPSAEPPPQTSCSPLLQASLGHGDAVPSRLPELEQQALATAKAKAPDARLSSIAVTSSGGGPLAPDFTFVAMQSGKVAGVFGQRCRLRTMVSDYDGSGYSPFDLAFIDLPTAVSAARVKGLRGRLERADLDMEPGRPQPVLVWMLQGNFAADIGTFYAVGARADSSGAVPPVWRCVVTSMDGSQFKCQRM